MSGFIAWLQTVYTFLALVPFVCFFAAWGIVYGLTKEKKKATYMAVDITTLFLIGSVTVMTRNIFQSGFGLWAVILLFLVVGGLLGSMQSRLRGKIDPLKIVRSLLRIGFVVLSASYVLLLFIGIGKYIAAS
ncbi:DUF3397 domain-containing protein [Paenibacillus doosanensis]|uniref:DUF3397 domain-containing protein n=1 Tax=Paenibacillus konkukensis TaxID=2020716 RepID=A0ABY4S0I9_9BACL|nr:MULTISPECIES: DUF3397 domain-containing protein [Paenibacillus]MCS7463427.1 DUF3397 domain-containing protein [Paenibacillus doosanensis]UQZ87037.1 hypothetical protein SK3146_06330 [Paenibacillus konkukensis]